MARNKRTPARPPQPVVPFAAAAHHHSEPAFEFTHTPGTNAQAPGGSPFDIPSYPGYLKSLTLEVEFTGGVAGTAHEDAPFRVFDNVSLLDVGGESLLGPGIDGFSLFLINLYGRYQVEGDARSDPDFVATTPNHVFFLDIPVEVHESTGLGSLANANAAETYKFTANMNTAANIWSVAPTTIPTVRVRGFANMWTLPKQRDLLGRLQAQAPPRHGTTQYWTRLPGRSVNAGYQTIPITKVGNMIRQMIFVWREGGVRTNAGFPDVIELRWDARDLRVVRKRVLRKEMSRSFQHAQQNPDNVPTGVFVFDFEGPIESPHMWLPTMTSSRLEIAGTFNAAGTLDILINEVAPPAGEEPAAIISPVVTPEFDPTDVATKRRAAVV